MFFQNAKQFEDFKQYNLTSKGMVRFCSEEPGEITTGRCECLNNNVLTIPTLENTKVTNVCWLKKFFDQRQSELELSEIMLGVAVGANLLVLTILIVIWICCHSKFRNERDSIKKTKAEGMITSATYNYE